MAIVWFTEQDRWDMLDAKEERLVLDELELAARRRAGRESGVTMTPARRRALDRFPPVRPKWKQPRWDRAGHWSDVR